MKFLQSSFGILLLLSFFSCKIIDKTTDRQELDNTRWFLTAIEQKPVSTAVDSSAFLNFDTKKQKVAGKSACNSFSTEYEMLSNNRISFAEISSTKMYCEGQMDEELQILNNLKLVKRYEIKTDRLYFYGDKGLLLTFKR